jgi:hypothetical protein
MEITAYRIHDRACKIVPGAVDRAWMDCTGERFAYRCLPMNIANASVWEVECPFSFTASWSGDKKNLTAIHIESSEPSGHFVQSHFGNGILTFHTGYLFRTPPRINLWVRGPVNRPKPRIQPLEGIVETDWATGTFTMNWMFNEPGTVQFEKGEPFCAILPYPRNFIEEFEGSVVPLSTNPELRKSYNAFTESRRDFLLRLPDPKTEANKMRWQKHYMLGKSVDDEGSDEHQTRLNVKAFVERSGAPEIGEVPKRPNNQPAEGNGTRE